MIDSLGRSGHQCAPCDVFTAVRFDVVLVAINSTYDIAALLLAVRGLEWWRRGRRRFSVIIGGAGLTNPTAIRHYADFAIFGRCEDWIADIMDDILCERRIVHEGVMCLPDLHPVKMQCATRLYPHSIGGWVEASIGCPGACAFCLYRWTRRWVGSGNAYRNLTLAGEASPELMFKDLLELTAKKGRLRCAIDGFSERLRFLYGKHISNVDIVNVIEHVGSFGPAATVLTVYNISNFPGENGDDLREFCVTVSRARPRHRVIFVVHSTPFRPSNCTPMMWEAVDLTDRSAWRQKRIVDRPELLVTHSFSIETAWNHLLSVMIERATVESDGGIWFALNLEKTGKLRARDKVREIKLQFPWLVEDATRAYPIGSREHPCSMVRGAYNWQTVEDRANRLRHGLTQQ